MDDERLKNLGGGGYFKELLERIRDIRASEKVFYRQVLEIYATSIDYDQADLEDDQCPEPPHIFLFNYEQISKTTPTICHRQLHPSNFHILSTLAVRCFPFLYGEMIISA